MIFIRFLLSFIFGIFIHGALAQRVGGGVLDTLEEQRKMKVNYPLTRGESTLPVSHSLLKFAPPIQNQGSTPSCISWATAYAGMTIVKRIEHGSLDVNPFSAMNLYNRVRPYDKLYKCQAGSIFGSNIELAKLRGVTYDNKSPEYCENLSANLVYNNKLFDYEDLAINAWNIKYSLARNRPVMIGMKMYTGEYWGTMSFDSTGIWNGTHKGALNWNHGMLIIGYDDRIAGGAFLVMNSWGTDFGKDGFFWLKYQNVSAEIVCAYALIPQFDRSKLVIGKTRGEEAIEIPNIIASEAIDLLDTNYNSPRKSVDIKIQNRCGEKLEFAIGTISRDNRESKGWCPIAADEDRVMTIPVNDSFFLYFNPNSKLSIINSIFPQVNFSINSKSSFLVQNNANEEMGAFTYISGKLYNNTHVLLTCVSEKQPCILVQLKDKVDTTNVLVRNQWWDGEELLYDPFSMDRLYPSKKGIWKVYLTDGEQRPKFIKLDSDKLKLQKSMLKFATEESAIKYIQMNK